MMSDELSDKTKTLYAESNSEHYFTIYGLNVKTTKRQVLYISWNIIRWILATILVSIALNYYQNTSLESETILKSCCDCYNMVLNNTITNHIYWGHCESNDNYTCKACSIINGGINDCDNEKLDQRGYSELSTYAVLACSIYVILMIILMVLLFKCAIKAGTWIINHSAYFIIMAYNAALTILYFYFIYNIYMYKPTNHNNAICLELRNPDLLRYNVLIISIVFLAVIWIPCLLSCFRVLFRLCKCYEMLKLVYTYIEQIIYWITIIILVLGLITCLTMLMIQFNFDNSTPVVVLVSIAGILLIISNVDIFLWQFGRDLAKIYCCGISGSLQRRLLRQNSMTYQSSQSSIMAS